MADHWQEPRFLISSALLGMLALSGLGWGIYKWYQVQTINYELPLTEAQKRIARFQLFNRIEVKSLIIQVPVFFILFTIVAAKSWLGLDVFSFIQHWIYAIMGSLVVALIITGYCRSSRIRNWRRQGSFWRRSGGLKERRNDLVVPSNIVGGCKAC
jgi:hypothetical protein